MWRRACMLAVVGLLAGCGGSDGPATAPTRSPSTAPVAAGFGPVGLAEAPDSAIWAAWSQSDVIAPVRPDGSAGRPVPVGRTPLRIVPLAGSLWVTTIGDGGLAQVDPSTYSVVRTVDLGGEPEGLATLGGHLFVVLQADGVLVEVDPADGSVVRRYDVGGQPRLVAAGSDALYVGDFAGGRVVRVVPGAGAKPLRSKAVCAGVQDVLVLDGAVWAACMTGGSVVSLDARTLALRNRVVVAGDPDGLTGGSGTTVLVSLQDGPALAVLDSVTGAVQRVFTGSSGRLGDRANNDVVERDGTAFLSDFTGNQVETVRLPAR